MAKKQTKRPGPIRVGIAGLGRAGWGMHCGEIDKRARTFKVVAGCDVEKRRCDMLSKRYDCPSYTKFADMLADPAVELVSVATRTPDHVDHALAALKAGKKVFLEKPIALSITEAKKLRKAVGRKKNVLFLRHNRRFESAFQHIREIMDSGILGDVYEIKLRRHSYQRRDDWQTLIACGGGQLLNWGPHVIDHALRFLDSPVVNQQTCLRKVAAVGDAEDHVWIILTGKNGRVVDLEISGGAAIGEPVYHVLGSKGALKSDGHSSIDLRYLDPKKKPPPRRAKKASPPIEAGFGSTDKLKWIEKNIPIAPKLKGQPDSIWDYVHASMRKGKPFPITLDEGLAVMEVITKAKRGTPFGGKAKKSKR